MGPDHLYLASLSLFKIKLKCFFPSWSEEEMLLVPRGVFNNEALYLMSIKDLSGQDFLINNINRAFNLLEPFGGR